MLDQKDVDDADNKRYAAALEVYDEFARTTPNSIQYSPFYRWCERRLRKDGGL